VYSVRSIIFVCLCDKVVLGDIVIFVIFCRNWTDLYVHITLFCYCNLNCYLMSFFAKIFSELHEFAH